MDLNKIKAVVRPRISWEAIDLGILMCRSCWWPMMRQFLLFVTIPSLAILLILFPYPIIAFSVIWWLKPIWDVVPMIFLSRSLFGEFPTSQEILKILRSVNKWELLLWLTWRRLSPNRSIDLPVTVLEKLSGKKRNQRLLGLHYKSGAEGIWLTIFFVHLEQIIWIGTSLFIFFLIPDEVELDWRIILENFDKQDLWFSFAGNLLWFSGFLLVEPFFVAAGFYFYLNCRSIAEGWDIELAFSRIAKKAQKNPPKIKSFFPGTTTLFMMAGLGFSILLSTPNSITAQELSEKEQAKATITEVMELDAFHKMDTTIDWSFLKDFIEKLKIGQFESFTLPDWLVDTIQFVARRTEEILYILTIGFLIYLLFLTRQWWFSILKNIQNQISRTQSLDETKSPSSLFGLEIARASLPENIPDSVLKLWKAQNYRDAWSLLYRASLSNLIHEYHLEFNETHTEYECVSLVNDCANPALSQFFIAITNNWLQMAYGHRMPPFSVLSSLCQQWSTFFNLNDKKS